jgi:signal transduction histidine kinase
MVGSVWRRHGREYLRDLALLVIAYYGVAHLGYALSFAGPVAAVVWLPVGVGIAFLYLRGARLWPGVVLGDLLVNNYSALPVGSAFAQSAGNLLEVLIAVLLLRRLCPRRPLTSLAGVGGVLAAIAAGTVVSATIGSIASWAGGVVRSGSVSYVWRTWWLGDLCGALIVLPLALAWSDFRWPRWSARATEAVVTAAALIGLSALVLQGAWIPRWLMFPALIWAALRFGTRGATGAIAVMSGFAIFGVTHALGGYAVGSIDSRLLYTQLLIAGVSASALSIAALVTERETLTDGLRASQRRLIAASDEARRRLERDLHDGAQERLVALTVRLQGAAERTRAADAPAANTLDVAQRELLTAIGELRDLARGIHPATLRQFGLGHAIRAVADRSTLPIETLEMPAVRLDDTSEATAYYVILEAITNAQRYAHASVVRVRARLRRRTLVLHVDDDGVGGAVEHEGSGLQGLRDRVQATGGRFYLDSRSGCGTHITAEIPLPRSAQRPAPAD